jgi:hypothetical protein
MTLAGDERMSGLNFLRWWSLVRASCVCIIAAVAASVLSAEPDVNRVREHFKSDRDTVKWGTASTFDSRGKLDIGDGSGHGFTLGRLRFQPGEGSVDVISI